ncbi:hypothetical protein K438DRAFT_242240 [Mycena galopus ATCC 62051]|nr:hypothetical protein K438DRAFT_242240 [Mycena galopus ATCC 62051]
MRSLSPACSSLRQQLTFTAHDLGHVAITHNWIINRNSACGLDRGHRLMDQCEILFVVWFSADTRTVCGLGARDHGDCVLRVLVRARAGADRLVEGGEGGWCICL